MSALDMRECPHCEGRGWYEASDSATGDPAQERCEFCLMTGKLYVLPPDHPLRTGEPSEAMVVAMRDAVNGLGPTSTLSPLWAAIGRAVLAVLRGLPVAESDDQSGGEYCNSCGKPAFACACKR